MILGDGWASGCCCEMLSALYSCSDGTLVEFGCVVTILEWVWCVSLRRGCVVLIIGLTCCCRLCAGVDWFLCAGMLVADGKMVNCWRSLSIVVRCWWWIVFEWGLICWCCCSECDDRNSLVRSGLVRAERLSIPVGFVLVWLSWERMCWEPKWWFWWAWFLLRYDSILIVFTCCLF